MRPQLCILSFNTQNPALAAEGEVGTPACFLPHVYVCTFLCRQRYRLHRLCFDVESKLTSKITVIIL
jgi:hypothetical protein